MTELDDLKSAWQTLNRTVERQNALAFHQIRENKLSRFRSGFRPLVFGQICQIIAGALLALWGGSFWVDHLGVAHLMIYGISMHAYGLMMILFAARDLFLIKRMDYAAPVLTLQKQIAELRRWHVRAGLWFGIAGCFIWIPLLLMIFYALGADVWARNPEVVGWFAVSGLASLGVLLAIIFWSRRNGREKMARNLENSSAGRSVNRAQALLDEIERFERE
ncbi:MAG: hypothetical protein H0V56_03025 [Chthoniobacterales bacterium]|nr:hypothetical protein [Chthoniobacterales bacterium]